MYGMYVSRMQGGGKYYNVVGIPILPFRAKVFIWRVTIGGSPLGSALHIPLEDHTHRFIKCPIGCIIWKYLSDVWHVLTHCSLMPQQWVFSRMFEMVRMTRWRYRSNFYDIMFDSRHGVKAYMKTLKDILMWNFWILEHVGIIFSNAYSGFLVA